MAPPHPNSTIIASYPHSLKFQILRAKGQGCVAQTVLETV